jgi:hypothetical protein
MRMYRARELIYRICLGILKTDQWKPNSKMNQGKPMPLSLALFLTRLGVYTKERRDHSKQSKADIQSSWLYTT